MKLFQTYATDTNFTNLIPLGGSANKPAIAQLTTRILGSALGSQTGFPHVVSLDTNRTSTGAYISRYITSHDYSGSINQNLPIDISSDQRGNYDYAYLSAKRFDGASAAIRGSVVAGIYAAASATPGGAYKLFNLNGNKYFGAGWGNHGNPASILNDFTMRSHVATRWERGTANAIDSTTTVYQGGSWKPTRNPLEIVTAFDGDRVSVIDFSKTRKLKSAYTWNPITEDLSFGNDIVDAVGAAISQTQDFIKFYLTGPKLHAGNTTDTDDIMVFRAIINSLSDSFQPNWTPQPMIGRADPNYQYTGFARDLNLDFTVYATSRDEVKPIWRKLNALAGYTAPIYDDTTIGLKGSWMRLTLGDLFIQQPVILTSLTYTLYDNESPWEINIEQDPTMMQVPIKIGVQCNFNVISDYLPQNGGRFYTLAKKFKSDSGDPVKGDHNWLSDFGTNADIEIKKREKKKKEDTLGDRPADPRGVTLTNSTPGQQQESVNTGN